MTNVRKAVFPGVIAGIIFMLFFISLLVAPKAVNASVQREPESAAQSENPAQPAAAQAGAESQPSVEEEQAADTNPEGCSVSEKFPESVRQWCDQIERYALEHDLEPNLIASVMLQESGGNPDAYSKSGAVGLLQVMPRDGLAANFQCINGPCFASRPSIKELSDPDYNIYYGTQMLAGLIDRHSGDWRDALKAYGPMDMGYQYADIILSIFNRYTN